MRSAAMIISGSRRLDIKTFGERAARVAAGFDALGVREGDSVALLMRNDLAFVEAVSGLNRLGAYAVPLNWHGKPDEIRYIVRDSAALFATVHADLMPLWAGAGLEEVRCLWVRTPHHIAASYGIDAQACKVPAGVMEWEFWLAGHAPSTEPPRPSRGVIVYTSGTTGAPKGIQRMPYPNSADEQAMSASIREVFGVREGVRTVVCGPLYHAMPNVHVRTALRSIGRDGLIVIEPRFDAERLLQLIQDYRINQLMLVPVMFIRLLRLPEAVKRKYDVSSIECVIHAAAPCPYEVKKAMIEWWGPVINEFYGTTETGAVTVVGSAEYLRKRGTVGRPASGCIVKILDEQGHELPVGVEGEICAINTSYPEFTYRNLPAERAKLDRAGLIATGDIGYFDADGYLYLCDRKKDMVISGGVNIYPAEIEGVLHSVPAVSDCAVFGIPDDEFGEALAAHVELMPGAQMNEGELRAYLSERLAGFKVPKIIRFDPRLPRDDNGKIYKRHIAEPYWRGTGRRI